VQTIHLSPSKIGNGTNSSAVITYHVSIRHSPHTLNSHTRSSSETPGLALLSSSVPSELYERGACLLDVEKDYTKKKKIKRGQKEKETEWIPCVAYTPDSSGLRSSLVTNRTTMREQAWNRVAVGCFGGCSARDTTVVRILEYPRINESCEFLLDFHLINFDGPILCVVCLI